MSARTACRVLLLCCALPTACAVPRAPPTTPAAQRDAAGPVQRLLEAFNAHDVEAMTRHVAEDVQWLSAQGGALRVETEGRAALAEAMTGYFRSLPSARSEVEALLVSGDFVAVRERVHWEQDGQPRSQAALAVYELRGDLVARVMYFAAER